MSSNWIWADTDKNTDNPVLMLFRKTFMLAEIPNEATIRISADSRYKLYVNDKFCEVGPRRGDHQVWFKDTLDINRFLQRGKNVLAVEVLRYPQIHHKGNHSIFRTEFPGLYVRGTIKDQHRRIILNADESWKTMQDEGFEIVSESAVFAPLQIYENRTALTHLQGWKKEDYDDSDWKNAKAYKQMNPAVSPGNLLQRPIPFLFRKPNRFERVITVRQSLNSNAEQDWNDLLKAGQYVTIPANQTEIVEICAENETTAYLTLNVTGGAGATIKILQAESYVQEGFIGQFPRKAHRLDWQTGHLEGFTDIYHVGGFGSEEHPEIYQPFWFRTFRFIRLEITTEAAALRVQRFDFEETGYPLEVKTAVHTSDASLADIWTISERTLRLCMHETYEDCPFYEQLQYILDSRSQILYTYAVSADDRLARQCMDDFRRSQRYDGLLNCSYPNFGPNVIPTFSLYYIFILHDHLMYFGDKTLLFEHLPTVERILRYFHTQLNEKGLVRKIGGLNGQARFWSFIDWTPEWDNTSGVPTAAKYGLLTIESLLYVMGLQAASAIADFLDEKERSKNWRNQAKAVQQALNTHCMGKKGMLTDTPNQELYSQHVQVFALLTDTVDLTQGKVNLLQTLEHQADFPQCSVAMAFYLFRALQKSGLYAWTERYWDIWRRMLARGATTCVENDVGERSDCHAWGALILYELPAVILGVQPAGPGYEAVSIQPCTETLRFAQGRVITPKGEVFVKWRKTADGDLSLYYELPENLTLISA